MSEYKDTGYRGDAMESANASTVSPIENKLTEAHNTLVKLEDNINRLAKKLEPVLNHNMDTPCAPSPPKEKAMGSPVYINLDELVDNLGRLVDRVNQINYKLEV